MSPCAAATQKNSGILGICTAVFSATLWLIYVITAWMLVTILNISIRKTDYNFSEIKKNFKFINYFSSGTTSSIFHLHAAKKCCNFPAANFVCDPIYVQFFTGLWLVFQEKHAFVEFPIFFPVFLFFWYLLCSRRKLALNARKAFSRISIENFLSNSSTSSFFFSAFWLLVIPLCNP